MVKKILFFSSIPAPYQLDFLDSLNDIADAQAIFLFEKRKNREWELEGRKWLTILNHSSRIKSTVVIWRVLSDFRPDLVLIGGYRLPMSGITKFVAHIVGSKVYYWLEKPHVTYGLKCFLKKLVWRFKFSTAEAILAIGNDAIDAYKDYTKTIYNFPYSINVSSYSHERQSHNHKDPLKILFVGQLIHRKGVMELINAFKSISPDQASLTIVGSGELIKEVESAVLSSLNITFLGFINPDGLPELYASHDVFIMPTRHDGWGLVISEAMASEMFIISTKYSTAMTEYIVDRKNGYYIEVDQTSICDSIRWCLRNRDIVSDAAKENKIIAKNSLMNSVNASAYLIKFI